MYIVNQHGVVHSIPDDWKLPAGARKATEKEVAAYEESPRGAVPPVAPVVEPPVAPAVTYSGYTGQTPKVKK